MKFRQLGIVLMIGGFLAGHLMMNLALRAAQLRVAAAGDQVSNADVAQATANGFKYAIGGDVVAMLGLILYIYGVVTYRGASATVVSSTLREI